MDGSDSTTLNGAEKDRLRQAAEMLLEARQTLQPMEELPPGLRPKTLQEAYFIQDVMLQALGELGGWKVGAPAPDATPLYAPMPRVSFTTSGQRIASPYRRLRGVEAEIAFLLGKDLPARAAPYSREEVVDAIAGCHPAMELLESALLDPDTADRLTAIADLQSNGGFVAGPSVSGWKDLNFATESAQMNVDGFVRVENGKNAAGSDLLRLVVWLANQAQRRTGGCWPGNGSPPEAGRAKFWPIAVRSRWPASLNWERSRFDSTEFGNLPRFLTVLGPPTQNKGLASPVSSVFHGKFFRCSQAAATLTRAKRAPKRSGSRSNRGQCACAST